MEDATRGKLRPVLRFVLFAALVAALIYGFSPVAGTRLGRVDDSRDRKTIAFELPALQGGKWSLADHRGDVVLVNFWATWCPPCRMETPGLVAIAKRYQSRGVRVAGISMDDEPARDAPAFVEQFHIPYPILMPTPDFSLASAIQSLPTSFLIDRGGHVARTYYGMVDEATLSRDIEQLLSERS